MAKTIEITNYSDNLVDAILAWKSGDETFNFDALTSKELYLLQDATGANLRTWICLAAAREARSPRADGPDYEGAILARQERVSL